MEECRLRAECKRVLGKTTGRPSDQARHAIEAWCLSVDVIERPESQGLAPNTKLMDAVIADLQNLSFGPAKFLKPFNVELRRGHKVIYNI